MGEGENYMHHLMFQGGRKQGMKKGISLSGSKPCWIPRSDVQLPKVTGGKTEIGRGKGTGIFDE